MKQALIFAVALWAVLNAAYFVVVSNIVRGRSGGYLTALIVPETGVHITSAEAAIAAARAYCKSNAAMYGPDSDAVRILANPLRAHFDGYAWAVEPSDDTKRFLAVLPARGESYPSCQFNLPPSSWQPVTLSNSGRRRSGAFP